MRESKSRVTNMHNECVQSSVPQCIMGSPLARVQDQPESALTMSFIRRESFKPCHECRDVVHPWTTSGGWFHRRGASQPESLPPIVLSGTVGTTAKLEPWRCSSGVMSCYELSEMWWSADGGLTCREASIGVCLTRWYYSGFGKLMVWLLSDLSHVLHSEFVLITLEGHTLSHCASITAINILSFHLFNERLLQDKQTSRGSLR